MNTVDFVRQLASESLETVNIASYLENARKMIEEIDYPNVLRSELVKTLCNDSVTVSTARYSRFYDISVSLDAADLEAGLTMIELIETNTDLSRLSIVCGMTSNHGTTFYPLERFQSIVGEDFKYTDKPEKKGECFWSGYEICKVGRTVNYATNARLESYFQDANGKIITIDINLKSSPVTLSGTPKFYRGDCVMIEDLRIINDQTHFANTKRYGVPSGQFPHLILYNV